MSEAIEFLKKGQVFKAQTVKGGYSFLYCRGVQQTDGLVHFIQSGVDKRAGREGRVRCYKLQPQQVLRMINGGDLEPISKDSVDWERFEGASLAASAMAKGISLDDYIEGRMTGEITPDGGESDLMPTEIPRIMREPSGE